MGRQALDGKPPGQPLDRKRRHGRVAREYRQAHKGAVRKAEGPALHGVVGLHSDEYGHELDVDANPIPNLWVAGVVAGDFHGSCDYPTICPGIKHGRCLTFGRLTGIQAAGGSVDEAADYEIKMPAAGGIDRSTL